MKVLIHIPEPPRDPLAMVVKISAVIVAVSTLFIGVATALVALA